MFSLTYSELYILRKLPICKVKFLETALLQFVVELFNHYRIFKILQEA